MTQPVRNLLPSSTAPTNGSQIAGENHSRNGEVPLDLSQRFSNNGHAKLDPAEVSRLARLATQGVVETRAKQLEAEKTRITLGEYWEIFFRNPRLQMRSISHYIRDAIDWANKTYGSKTVKKYGEELTDFAFLKLPWRPPETSKRDTLFGQLLPWNKYYRKIASFERYAFPNNFILFHGPTSTGKSIGFDALFELLSEYSHTEEGALYSLEFIFPNRSTFSGFESDSQRHERESKSSGLIPQKDIAAQIPASQRTNPFFLYNTKQRLELIRQVKDLHLLPDDFNTNFAALYNLDDLSRRVLDGLIELYRDPDERDGSISNQVLNHLEARRWFMSTTSGDGICVLQPSAAPGTFLKPIIPEIQWDALDPKFVNVLASARLDTLEGVLGSSQIIYYDDMFAGVDRHHELDEYLYLLRQAEKGDSTVTTPGGTLTKKVQTNVLVCGTANDSVIKKAEGISPENAANIFTRGECISVGYQPLFRDLEEFLNKKLSTIISDEEFRKVSPNVTHATAMFLAMTYVFPAIRTGYYDGLKLDQKTRETLRALALKLTPLEKILLYEGEPLDAYETNPHNFKYTSDDLKLLYACTSLIHDEYSFGSSDDRLHLYEGITGIPPRYAEKVLAEAIISKLTSDSKDSSFSLVELFNLLEEKAKKKFEYEGQQTAIVQQLKEIQEKAGKSKGQEPKLLSSSDTLGLLKTHMIKRVSYEVRKATGLMKTRKDLLKEFQKYIAHMIAYTQRTKVAPEWRVTSSMESPDEIVMREFETKTLDIPETRKDAHRGDYSNKIGAWGWDNKEMNPFDHLDEEKLFKREIDMLEASNTKQYDGAIDGFLEDLKDFVTSSPDFDITSIPELPSDSTPAEAEVANKFATEFLSEINLPAANNDPNRKRVLLKGLKGLQSHGYQKLDLIRKDVVFAFNNKAAV